MIFGLMIGALVVIFALQNIFAVTVTFLVWELTTSLALLVAICVLVGLLTGILLSVPESIRNIFVISKLKKENKKLSDELKIAQTRPESIDDTTEKPIDL